MSIILWTGSRSADYFANEAAPMTPIVKKLIRKGIPVILVDRKILSDKYTAYISR